MLNVNVIFSYLILFLLLVEFSNCNEKTLAAVKPLKNTSNGSHQIDRLNFLLGIAEIAIELDNDTQCGFEMLQIFKSIENNEIWALKLIDSFGNVPKSFAWGNYFWFSSYELCDDLNDPYHISLSSKSIKNSSDFIKNTTSPFPVEFRVIYYNFTTPIFIDLKLEFETIHVGLCVPKSCNESKIRKYAAYYFGNQTFELQRRFRIEMKEVDSKIPGYRWTFLLNTGVILFLISFLLVVTFTILAEVVFRLHQRLPEVKKTERNSAYEYSSMEKFFLCFDIRDNVPRLLKVEESRNFLPVIAGLRTIVCLWVTLFHVYYYSLFTIRNIPLLFSKLENFVLQPILQSCFYVDVFFVISAFLLVYNFFSNQNCVQTIKSNSFGANLKLFLNFILHRFVRLMPVLFITMLLSEIVFEFLNMFSPFKMDKFSGLYCRDNWWYNLLFINNLLDLKYICASWSWYLGCEMQFFILFLLILFIYVKNESIGKTIFILSAITFLAISCFCNFYNQITFQIDVIYSTLEELYVKPWVRINPYFGGAFMGWLHYKTKANGIKINSATKISFWIFSFLVYVLTIYMSYWRSAPVWVVAIIMSFGKMFFGLFVGSLILLCQQGHGKYFNSIMGSKLFMFLNKFCYSIYMIAPIIIAACFGLRTESTQFSEVGSGLDFIAIIAMTFGGSMISVLLLEIPFQKLSNRFILKR